MALDVGNDQPEYRTGDRGATSPPDGWTVGLVARRRNALHEAAAELGPAHRRPDRPGVALRDYGAGCVCVGIAGPVDRDGAARLQVLLDGLRGRARHELVITLAGVGPSHPQLARVLAHTRIRYLVAGAHVEFRDLPDDMVALRDSTSTTFRVADTRRGARPGLPGVAPIVPLSPADGTTVTVAASGAPVPGASR